VVRSSEGKVQTRKIKVIHMQLELSTDWHELSTVLVPIRKLKGRAPMPGNPAAWEPTLLSFVLLQ